MKKFILPAIGLGLMLCAQSVGAVDYSAQFNGFKQWCYYAETNQPCCEDIGIVYINGDSAAVSLTYTYQWGENEPVEKEIILSQATCTLPEKTAAKVGKGGQTSFFCDFGTAPATPGEYTLKLTLTKINGQPNKYYGRVQTNTVTVVAPPTLPAGYRTFTFGDSEGVKTARGYNASNRRYNVGIVLDSINTPELIGATILGIRITDVPSTGITGIRAYITGCKNVPTFSGFASIQNVTPENSTIDCLFLHPASFPYTWTSQSKGVAPKIYNKIGIGYTFFVQSPLNDSTRYPVMSSSMSSANPNSFFITQNGTQQQYGFSEAYWDNKSNDWGAAPITLYYLPADTGTGIEELSQGKDVAAEYYDLQGRRLTQDVKGLVIEKRGNKARKIIR